MKTLILLAALLVPIEHVTLEASDPEDAMIDAVATRLERYPTIQLPDGRRAAVSDGVHTQEEFAAGAATRVHRGVDITWPRKATLAKGTKDVGKPWGSRGYLAPEQRLERPVLAAGAGRVVLAVDEWTEFGKTTGAAVYIDHGELLVDGKSCRLVSGYHHLELKCCDVGSELAAGQLLGIMGASPPRYREQRAITPFAPDALVHLHFDLLLMAGAFGHPTNRPPAGRYLDGEDYIKRLRQLEMEDVWGAAVQVGHPDGHPGPPEVA